MKVSGAQVMQAINKKYQCAINKAYKNLRAYHETINKDGTFENEKENDKNERKAEKLYNSYLDIILELPKREQTNFNKQHKNIHGYEG